MGIRAWLEGGWWPHGGQIPPLTPILKNSKRWVATTWWPDSTPHTHSEILWKVGGNQMVARGHPSHLLWNTLKNGWRPHSGQRPHLTPTLKYSERWVTTTRWPEATPHPHSEILWKVGGDHRVARFTSYPTIASTLNHKITSKIYILKPQWAKGCKKSQFCWSPLQHCEKENVQFDPWTTTK